MSKIHTITRGLSKNFQSMDWVEKLLDRSFLNLGHRFGIYLCAGKWLVGVLHWSKHLSLNFSFYICVNTFCECLLIILRVYEIWTYLLMNIFSIALFKINFFYQYLLNITRIKFRSFLKKDIVYNIFENCNFRFDEWFSKKSYGI